MRLSMLAAAVLTALILITPAPAFAQQHRVPDLAEQRAAMARIAGMVGDWQGEANVTFPVQRLVHQSEHIESAMGGLLLVIRGTGYATADRTGAPIFNAFGVISYDDARDLYEFRVYNDGRAATATARFLDDGRLQWTMDFSPVIIRYTIALNGDTWRETGEMSRDAGATWTPTIEMALRRIP
ncbi:MAG TPA: hypothetical protein VFO00_14205 [Vitreimonas sp.]|nr:hypothetical protein [Vitreimonas sp.]